MAKAAVQAGAEDTKRARGRPRLEDTAAIEGRLLDVALAEFLAHGYGGASMRQIVRAAQMSRTTLYARYPSKEALFRSIMQRQIERLSAFAALSTANGVLGLEEGLESYADRSLAISLEGDGLMVNRLIHAEAHRFPELGAAAAERTELGVAQIAWFIRQRADTDGIPCRDPVAIARGFILMLRGWYVNVMLDNRPVAEDERRAWAKQATHILIAGRAEW